MFFAGTNWFLDRAAALPPALAAVHKELKRVARDFGLVVKGFAVIYGDTLIYSIVTPSTYIFVVFQSRIGVSIGTETASRRLASRTKSCTATLCVTRFAYRPVHEASERCFWTAM